MEECGRDLGQNASENTARPFAGNDTKTDPDYIEETGTRDQRVFFTQDTPAQLLADERAKTLPARIEVKKLGGAVTCKWRLYVLRLDRARPPRTLTMKEGGCAPVQVRWSRHHSKLCFVMPRNIWSIFAASVWT